MIREYYLFIYHLFFLFIYIFSNVRLTRKLYLNFLTFIIFIFVWTKKWGVVMSEIKCSVAVAVAVAVACNPLLGPRKWQRLCSRFSSQNVRISFFQHLILNLYYNLSLVIVLVLFIFGSDHCNFSLRDTGCSIKLAGILEGNAFYRTMV